MGVVDAGLGLKYHGRRIEEDQIHQHEVHEIAEPISWDILFQHLMRSSL